MSKRGVSHIEIVLSFIIFVGAIAFALYFFSPSDSDRLVDSSLSYSFREISDFTEIEIISFSVNIDGGAVNTYEIDNGLTVDAVPVEISGVDENYGIKAEKHTGEALVGLRLDDFVHIQRPATGWSDVNFISIDYSDEFGFGSGNIGTHEESYYTLSSSTSKKVISENKFNELSQSYLADYTELKKEFNLPPRVNFGFSLEYSDGDIKAERQIPENLEVFSEIQRVELLRENEEVEFGDLTVWVW